MDKRKSREKEKAETEEAGTGERSRVTGVSSGSRWPGRGRGCGYVEGGGQARVSV